MRAGGVAKTAAVNSEAWLSCFEEVLKEGKDVLCLAFSSGLSTTYNSARIAAGQLSETYKDAKIIVIDTLCASAGEGLLVRLAVNKKNEGATIDETAEYVKENVLRVCHWFTVDDLVYLKRGGRISSAAAFFGNMIGIKPVLHVDDEGHLTKVTTARGRKASLTTLADKLAEAEAAAEESAAKAAEAETLRGKLEDMAGKLESSRTFAASLREQLKKAEADPKIPKAKLEQIRKEAEEAARKEAEAEAAADLEEAKKRAATAEADAIAAKLAAKQAQERLEEAQKKLKTASPEVTAFKALFDSMQGTAAKLRTMIEKIRSEDPETADKLAAALKAFGSSL